VLTAVARGSAHELAGRPLQDAVGFAAYPADGPRWLAVAVADGHGGHPHFRSARGSELAVEAGLQLAGETAAQLAAGGSAGELRSATREQVVPELIGSWRRAVEQDLSENPWTSRERQVLSGDDITIAYGSTLMLAVVTVPWLVLCQIGDGDVVMVGADGMASLPVPGDPRLDGHSTTSLCQPNAADAFRLAVVDLTASSVAALLLATDGFGNAQAADPWYQSIGGDLVRLARERGVAWVREQLPVWAARCASAEGSGDDTAVALLLPTEIPQALDAAPSMESSMAMSSTQTWPSVTLRPPARRRVRRPPQAEPAQTEPPQAEPARTQPAQTQPPPAQPEPAQPERTRPAETLPWTRRADPPTGKTTAAHRRGRHRHRRRER
jgi:hypothetical protein